MQRCTHVAGSIEVQSLVLLRVYLKTSGTVAYGIGDGLPRGVWNIIISDEFIIDCQVLAHLFEDNAELIVACDVFSAICNSCHILRQPDLVCDIADTYLAHYQEQIIFNIMAYPLVSSSEPHPERDIRFGIRIQQLHEVTIVGLISLE